jgi:DNA processing protein
MLVTCATDVRGHITLAADEAHHSGLRSGPVTARDLLDPVAVAVLEEVPIRGGRGPASIAVRAGVDLDTALRCLGELAAGGFVERCDTGWRSRKLGQAGRTAGSAAAGYSTVGGQRL